MKRQYLLTGLLAFAWTTAPQAQTPRDPRVSAQLWQLVQTPGGTALAPAPALNSATSGDASFTPAPAPTADGAVVISAIAEGAGDALAGELALIGAQEPSVAGGVVSARLPINAIPSLSGLTQLRFARPAIAVTQTGKVTSQGDLSVRGPQARAEFPVTGYGIRVGILSDSFNAKGGMSAGILSDELPSDIVILKDVTGAADEGRAMGEIIHDLAPGAALRFYTAMVGDADFANGIRELHGAGCQVIVDDVLWLHEPMFTDGIIAQAVDDVTAAGAAYFSAAGNTGEYNGFTQAFSETTGGYHDFDPASGTDTSLNVIFPTGTTWISLQWADRYRSADPACPGAATDLDIEVVDGNGVPIPGLGGFDANVGQDPVEVFGVQVSAPKGVYWAAGGLRIKRKAGPVPPLFKLIWYCSSTPGMAAVEYYTATSTLFGHANARGAIATGAAWYCNTPAWGVAPPVVESFSARGGTPIFYLPDGTAAYELRLKPDLCAPDGGDNTFFGWDQDCNGGRNSLPNFFGTSAAAPHAAAVAALMLQARPATNPERVRTLLQETGIDMADAGFDLRTGAGLIQADAALRKLTLPPPVLKSVVSRRTHGTAGTFDLNMPLVAPCGIELRAGNRPCLVFCFDRPIAEATPIVVHGVGTVSAGRIVGSEVRVDLTGVSNRQWLEVGLDDVTAADGGFLPHASVKFGMLAGDVNRNGQITSSDISGIQGVMNMPVGAGNFRADVNANGMITSADVSAVSGQIGALLPQLSF